MNEEELAALAEQLYANGLSDDDVALHLDRALMGQQPEEQTTPLEAFATHALDAIVGPPGSLADRSAHLRSMPSFIDPQRAADNRAAYDATLNAGEEEHPNASIGGGVVGLASPLVAAGLAKGAQVVGSATAKGAGATGRFIKSLAKGAARETRIGRAITRGVQDFKGTAPQPPAPKVEGLEPIVPERAANVPAPAPKSAATPAPPVDRVTPGQVVGTRTTGGGATVAQMNPKVQQIIDDARAKRIAEPPVNPRTGKPVTVDEIQSALEKEARVNKVVKERKQRGATRAQLEHRQQRAAAAKVPQSEAPRFEHMTEDELRAWIANESIGDAQRGMMRRELERRIKAS